jgi:hypothetical protein
MTGEISRRKGNVLRLAADQPLAARYGRVPGALRAER